MGARAQNGYEIGNQVSAHRRRRPQSLSNSLSGEGRRSASKKIRSASLPSTARSKTRSPRWPHSAPSLRFGLSSPHRVKPASARSCVKGLGPHAHAHADGRSVLAHRPRLRPGRLLFARSSQKAHTPVPAARFDVLFVQSIGHVTRQATKSTQKKHGFGHTYVSRNSPHLVRICKEI